MSSTQSQTMNNKFEFKTQAFCKQTHLYTAVFMNVKLIFQ